MPKTLVTPLFSCHMHGATDYTIVAEAEYLIIEGSPLFEKPLFENSLVYMPVSNKSSARSQESVLAAASALGVSPKAYVFSFVE